MVPLPRGDSVRMLALGGTCRSWLLMFGDGIAGIGLGASPCAIAAALAGLVAV